MAAITERGGKFLTRVRRDGFRSVAKTFTRRADAVAWGKRVEADMEAGRWVEKGSTIPTLREAIAEYRAAVGTKLKGAKTYAYWWDELASAPVALKRVDDVTPFDLAAWRDDQATRVQAGTVARKLGLLSGVFTWCQKERGWIGANPLRLVRKPRVNDARERTLSDAELSYLRRAATTSRAAWLGNVLTVLLRSAMRRGEVFSLKRGDVDFARSVAHLKDTKNGSARDVPLCPEALAALQCLDAGAAARGQVALCPLAAAPAISLAFRRTVSRALRMYVADCARQGEAPAKDFLADLHLHDVRHTAVTAWASTGALSLSELMLVSGHRDSRMLTRYVNLKATTLAGKMAGIAAA